VPFGERSSAVKLVGSPATCKRNEMSNRRVYAIAPCFASGWRAFFSVPLCKSTSNRHAPPGTQSIKIEKQTNECLCMDRCQVGQHASVCQSAVGSSALQIRRQLNATCGSYFKATRWMRSGARDNDGHTSSTPGGKVTLSGRITALPSFRPHSPQAQSRRADTESSAALEGELMTMEDDAMCVCEVSGGLHEVESSMKSCIGVSGRVTEGVRPWFVGAIQMGTVPFCRAQLHVLRDHGEDQ
jgi:hypothetical protein